MSAQRTVTYQSGLRRRYPVGGVHYWAVNSLGPDNLAVTGSHYGVLVDEPLESGWTHGRVWTTRELAEAHAAWLPSHYKGTCNLILREVVEVTRPAGAPESWWLRVTS